LGGAVFRLPHKLSYSMRFVLILILTVGTLPASTLKVYNHSGADVTGTIDGETVVFLDARDVEIYGEELDIPGRVVVTLDDADGYVLASVILDASAEYVTTTVDPGEVDMRKLETSALILAGLVLFRIIASGIRVT